MITFTDKVVVTDPCYIRGTWCGAYEVEVKPGEYKTSIETSDEGDWGIRVAELKVKMVGETVVREDAADFMVGVDSGQAGIFCDTLYPEGEVGEFDGDGSFYDQCCNITLSDEQYGEIQGKGFLSSSGFGDGGYSCYLGYNTDNQVVSIRIVFIDEAEEEEFYE